MSITRLPEKETPEMYRISHPDGEDFGLPSVNKDEEIEKECPHPCTIPINCRRMCPFEGDSR